jgi:hypothetical protein
VLKFGKKSVAKRLKRHTVTKLAMNWRGESVWGLCCLGLRTGRLSVAKSIHAGYNLEWGLVGPGGRLGGTLGSALGATCAESEQGRNYIFVRVNSYWPKDSGLQGCGSVVCNLPEGTPSF